MHCSQVASAQRGVESHIFNTVGSGVKGGGTPGYAVYGATKRGLPQLTDSLVKELEEGVEGYDKEEPVIKAWPNAVERRGLGKVNVHTLSPGMVFTDLLLNDSTPKLRKFPFGVLAAQPPEVAADLVPKILAVRGNGNDELRGWGGADLMRLTHALSAEMYRAWHRCAILTHYAPLHWHAGTIHR
eukprot:scaffold117891_cov34-Tisochrysis_lutea.AAC.5